MERIWHYYFKRRFICLAYVGVFVLWLMCFISEARVITPNEAMEVAENFVSHIISKDGSWGGAKDAYIASSVEIKARGKVLGYFFSVEPQGYIVVSKITQMSPVKFFSTSSNLDINNTKGMADLIKDVLGATITSLEQKYGDLGNVPETIGSDPDRTLKVWDWLLGKGPEPNGENYTTSGPLLQRESREIEASMLPDSANASFDSGLADPTTGPLLSTSWHQGDPYNYNCPNGDGGRTVVGCVATAASQIMKYWNYPLSGTGSHSYTWNGDQSCGGTTAGQTLSADFSDSYDWENILNSYGGSYSDTQRDAVAELCYEVGVAFEMDYGRCGSYAYTGDAVTVFPTYFKYANTTSRKNRSDYTTDQDWFNEIRKEFDNPLPRPLQYAIHRSGWGGHSIVCDGYRVNGTNYIHLNYGWGGSSDGWYSLGNIPCGSATCDPNEEYAVFGIQPRNRLYMRVKGLDNGIYGKWMDHNETWKSSWRDISGASGVAPAQVTFMNRLYIAVKGTDNRVYIRYKDYKGDLSAWSAIPGGSTSHSPALAVFNNRLYVAVKASSGYAVYINYMDTGGTWHGWSQVPDFGTDDSPALAGAGDYLYIACKGLDNKFYIKAMDGDGNWKYTYGAFKGFTTHAPALAPFGYWNNQKTVAIAVRGLNGHIYRSFVLYGTIGTATGYGRPTYGTGSNWEEVPGGSTSTSPSLAPMPQLNKLYLAVKGASNNNIYYISTSNPYSGGWGSWNQVPGATDDTPSIWVQYYYIPSN